MTTFYTVAHYIPSAISGERLNIGVIAWDATSLHCRFLSDWRRIAYFAGDQDLTSLKAFASDVEAAAQSRGVDSSISPEYLTTAARRWINCLQLAEPKASTKPSLALIELLAKLYLVDRAPQLRAHHRTRRTAISIASSEIREVLVRFIGDRAKEYVKRDYEIEGALDRHSFDLAVANGRPYLAVQAISFETTDAKDIRKQIDVAAWTISDVRKYNKHLPIGVAALPPRRSSDIYDKAVTVFTQLGATVLPENKLSSWAASIAKDID